MEQRVTVTSTGHNVLMQDGDQVLVYGRILLLRREHCVVLISAGPQAGKKIDMPLTYPAIIGGVTYNVDIPAPIVDTAAAVEQPKARAKGGVTKIALCKTIYKEMVGASKADVIARFISEAQCTPQGANTYYLTCKKG